MSLQDDPFDFSVSKDGRIRISRGGRVVVTVGAAAGERLRAQLEQAASSEATQQLLARATGNYRRGNERQGRA